jgi:hypothetical protein
MAVFITGDAHGDIIEFQERMKSYSLTADDVLIICGDFGFDWNARTILEWMKFNHDYTVLFCDGNHENFDNLKKLKRGFAFGDAVGVFADRTYRLFTGRMYDIQGFKTFVFGGAASIDKDWRILPEYVAAYGKLWWKEEVPSKATFEFAKKTLKENNWTFDLFISHTCRPGLKRKALKTHKEDFRDPTEEMIEKLETTIKAHNGSWKASYFGHFHTDVDNDKYHCLYKRVVKVGFY